LIKNDWIILTFKVLILRHLFDELTRLSFSISEELRLPTTFSIFGLFKCLSFLYLSIMNCPSSIFSLVFYESLTYMRLLPRQRIINSKTLKTVNRTVKHRHIGNTHSLMSVPTKGICCTGPITCKNEQLSMLRIYKKLYAIGIPRRHVFL